MSIRMPLAAALIAFAGSIQGAVAMEIGFPITWDSLSNGLKVLIVRDTNVAVVSCRLYYFVGSMYEGPGTSGLSHLYEHMMFKGTKRLGTRDLKKELAYMAKLDSLDARFQRLRASGAPPTDPCLAALRDSMAAQLKAQREYIVKDELWDLYQTSGGTNLNAWTSDDMTAYIVTLPANKLELFYWLESDRMRDPILREFQSERDVVIEERRMRYDNRPVNKYYERLNALFYIAHPYRIPTIGWVSDIESHTRIDMEAHVRRYYTPDNAIVVLAGNVDAKKALADIKRYFGTIPRASQPKREVVTREPAPSGQTRFTMRDKADPRIDIMYHTPGYPSHDLYALDIIEGVLNGRSGRLYRKLVTELQWCTDAGAGNSVRLHDSYFQVYATLKDNANPDSVEAVLQKELAALASTKPQQREIDRVKNAIRMSFVSGLKELEVLSDRLAWYQRLGNWRDLASYPDSIAAVVPDSIPGVVARLLKPELATVGLLLTPVTDTTSRRAKGGAR